MTRSVEWRYGLCCRTSLMFVAAVFGLAAAGRTANGENSAALPNIVLIFTDDQGYADVGCYGAEGIETPHLDRLAAEGIRFTDFYATQPVCSSSRAGLLTGCYPNRIGIVGALGPKARHGLDDAELTIPEVLKRRDYATAMYGKWHLGHHPRFLPMRHGFDEYFGLPYSNDMWPKHPDGPKAYPDLPLIEGEKTIALNPDQTQLTTWYTEHAVQFIERMRDRPFFVYVAHNMPHVPLFASDKYRGKSEKGLLGDVLTEIDWSVGQILAALDKHNLDERTLVIFTSDNGPWLLYGNHAGSAGPLREGKATTFDGGVRVPCIMRWPGRIRPGRECREPCMTIDILPTIARLVDVQLSQERKIDGLDIRPLMFEEGAKSPHEALYFYWLNELQAVRSGKWKLHLPHKYPHLAKPGADGRPGRYEQQAIELALFDLESDPGETTNLAQSHPDVVERLQRYVEQAREDLGDTALKRAGRNVRAPGRLD